MNIYGRGYLSSHARRSINRVWLILVVDLVRAKMASIHLIGFIMAILVTGTCLGEFVKTSNCTCPGDVVVYNCHVNGIGFTIWRGSAFDCTNSQILLRHSSFGNGGTMGQCNDGAIVGRSLGVNVDALIYSSELRVNLMSNPELIGRTIECVYRNSGGNEMVIGSSTIQITDPLPPPTNIQLLSASPQQLTFNWTPVQSNCSTLQYSTISDCGTCTYSNDSRTTQASMMCAIAQPTTDERLCTFSVQSIVCGNMSGVWSTPLEVTLKVPISPAISDVTFVPHYNVSDNKLIELDIEFIEFESFMISSGVDGSALNYTVSYTDSSTSATCDSLIIPASSCVQNVCTVPRLDPVPCSQSFNGGIESIDIAISATNILGKGPASLFKIDVVNHLVSVTFESANRVVCLFVGLQDSQTTRSLSCVIVYGLCQQQLLDSRQEIHGTSTSFSTVVIDLPASIQSGVHCYTVNASNGTFTVLVEGITGTVTVTNDSPNQPNTAAIIVGVILVIVVLFAFALAILVILFVLRFHHRKKSNEAAKIYHAETDTTQLMDDYSDRAQMITAHITFDLEDKPKELLKALKALKNINLQNITAGSHVANPSMKKIYIECGKELTEAEKMNIIKSDIGVPGSLVVTCEAKQMDYMKNEDSDVNVEIRVSIKHEPGTLLRLLEFIYSLEDWQHINLTDIIVSRNQTGPYRRVVIKFLSDVTSEWKKKYDKEKSSCRFIETSTVYAKV